MENQKVTPRVIATVWRHWVTAFKRSKAMIVGTIVCYSLAMYVDLMYKPTKWKEVFDNLNTHQSPWKPFELIIISAIMGWILSRGGETCIVFAECKIIKDLKDYCMRKLLGKSTHFFTTYPSGSLVAKAKRFSQVSEWVMDEFVFSIIKSLLLIVYLLIYTSILIPELTVAFVLWIVIFMTITVWLSKIRMRFDLKSSTADSVTTGHISDIILSVFTLRMFSAVPRVQQTFEAITKDEELKRKRAWFIGNMQWSVQGLLGVILEWYCMSTIISLVEAGRYSVGTAILVQAYIATLTMYMWGFGRSLIKIRTAFADAHEMAQLLDETSSEPIVQHEEVVTPKNNGITFSDVTFGYSDQSPTLQNFSFKFLPGRRYGIVGKSGSGKSTLVKLMLRAYDQRAGCIQVCDESIDEVNKLVLRSWISYVPQDPQFPSWTVREIIAMGNPTATDEEILLAAKKASCEFIWEKLPQGFTTKVGERGIKLSGGERQRLAIAAAILKDAPIVVMDEPTSALDPQTEQAIQTSLRECFQAKTLIVIAHRLATVAILDEIILLENGSVKDFGPHDSLLQTSIDYREMWELQTQPHIN